MIISISKILNACILSLVLSYAFFPTAAHAGFGFNIDGTLDKKAISHAYFEGEFSRILPPLETFRQSYPNPSKDDQIFVYKYLSVIYAADSSTRKKAECYMIQLVKLMPTIELIDLYISDNIEAIFKNPGFNVKVQHLDGKLPKELVCAHGKRVSASWS